MSKITRSFVGRALACTGFVLMSGSVLAQVQIQDAWIRATVPQQSGTGGFMKLTAAQDTALVGVSSPLTPATEVHEMAMDGNVMRMRPIAAIPLPAGKTVELKPGGYHVMLMNLKQQVKVGDQIPLTLILQKPGGERQTQEIQVPVRALTSDASGHEGHGNHDGHKH